MWAGRDRWRGLLLPAAVVYLASRATCLAAFALASALPGGMPVRRALAGHDGYWYLRAVTAGYPARLPTGAGDARQSTVAFFPVYPLVVRAAHVAAGVTPELAALAVGLVAGVVALPVVALVSRQVLGDGEAVAVAALLSFAPAAYVLSLAYSEALFLALSAGSLLAMLRRRWLAAGLLAAVASGTRPTGLVLVLCLAVAAVGEVRRGGPRAGWRPLTATAIAPTGLVAFLGYLWAHTGSLTAYPDTERVGWGTHFDGGLSTARLVVHALLHPLARPPDDAVAAFVLLVVLAAVLLLLDRPPLVLGVWGGAVAYLALSGSTGTFSSIPRLVLPAFPLLFPLVRRARTLLPAMVGASAALLGGSTVVVATSAVITP